MKLSFVLVALTLAGCGAAAPTCGEGTHAEGDSCVADVSSCGAESDAELCADAGFACGTHQVADSCGTLRSIGCGPCTACDGACADGVYDACTCGAGDPCAWAGDDYCDAACADSFPANHFDDAVDCVASSPGKRVFVTTRSFHADLAEQAFMLDGLAAGDSFCSAAAAEGGLGGTWRAWLSSSTVDARDRLTDVSPWYLNGTDDVVFQTKDELSLWARVDIDHDQFGDPIDGHADVWTGTAYGVKSASCGDWTTQSGRGTAGLTDASTQVIGTYGNPDWNIGPDGWDSFYWVDGIPCNIGARLYCFEQ